MAKKGEVKGTGLPDRVWYSVGRTVQVRQYEPVKFDVGAARDVPEGEDSESIFEALREEVDDRLNCCLKEIQAQIEGKPKKAKTPRRAVRKAVRKKARRKR